MSKTKLTNLEKEIQNYMKEERNKRSLELFDKNEWELQIAESMKLDQYIYDLEHPVWKPIYISNEMSNYSVSNIGEVKKNQETIMFPYMINSGYKAIKLTHNKIRKSFLIHHLVAEAFIPNPENKPQVNHINGKKTCNWVGNLEWVTQSENMRHAIDNNLWHPKHGTESPFSKHNEAQIHMACAMLENRKYTKKEICENLNISPMTLDGILYRNKWKSISHLYDIPRYMNPSSKSWDDSIKNSVIDLYNGGISNKNRILEELNFPINNANRLRVNRIINKVKSSTTIEPSIEEVFIFH